MGHLKLDSIMGKTQSISILTLIQYSIIVDWHNLGDISIVRDKRALYSENSFVVELDWFLKNTHAPHLIKMLKDVILFKSRSPQRSSWHNNLFSTLWLRDPYME